MTLDYLDTDGEITSRHCAFLVSEDDFDAISARVREAGLTYWADPYHRRAGGTNHNDGGRDVRFEDPNGHNPEILTRPYGSGG
ncbi:hypothetical protein ACIBAI_05285 [Streptomyces sp. NPDC051041]|uniref:hypothetical protein n=1 Tax=Streptomyces sp. NPDC051041 TaxID=3365640 RepID=UPI00378D2B7B